jgi:hypothetical protein
MDNSNTVAPIREKIRVEATPEKAFEAFTGKMGRWWNRAYTINASPLKDVKVEGRRGGRWFEVGDDGSQCDWGRVLVWQKPGRIVLAWQVNADWKFDPDLVTELEVQFGPDGAGTRVELEHRNLDRYGGRAEAMRGMLASPDGWLGLLKRFGETTAA